MHWLGGYVIIHHKVLPDKNQGGRGPSHGLAPKPEWSGHLSRFQLFTPHPQTTDDLNFHLPDFLAECSSYQTTSQALSRLISTLSFEAGLQGRKEREGQEEATKLEGVWTSEMTATLEGNRT